MQLVIMSDTHGDAEIISAVKQFYPHANYFIHCGDSELAYDHPHLQSMVRVRGNCDFFKDAFPDEELIDVANERIFVAHGHHFNVKSTLMPLSYRAQEVGASIVCFGHSHLLGAEKIGETLFLNPGSLRKPRGRKDKSFIVLTITEQAYNVQCLNDRNELLEQYTFEK